MSLSTFIELLEKDPEAVTFEHTMNVIEKNYSFKETLFTNGELKNGAGHNNGSCKIFAFGKINNLSESQALHCFGEYYRKDVLENPEGDDHHNIRNFIILGWQGIRFESEALVLK